MEAAEHDHSLQDSGDEGIMEHEHYISNSNVVTSRDHFPLCIVWCPIPGLTWLIPPIGHLGIVTSQGIIHDFAGPYYVNRDAHRMAFGAVTKYLPVDVKSLEAVKQGDGVKAWDNAIEASSRDYDHQLHNLLCNNCHSHVSQVLNELQFQGFKHWNTLFLILYFVLHARFVSFARLVQTYAGFFAVIVICLIVFFFTRT